MAIRNVPGTPDLRTFAGAAPESDAWLSFCRDIFVNRHFAPRAGQAALRVGGLQGSDSVSTRTLPLNPSRIRSHSKSSFLSVNFSDAAAGKFTLFPSLARGGLLPKTPQGLAPARTSYRKWGRGGGLGIPLAIPRRASRSSARGGRTLHIRTHHQPIRHYPTMNLSSSLRTLAISIDPGS